MGKAVARSLAENEGVLGHVSVDLVCFEKSEKQKLKSEFTTGTRAGEDAADASMVDERDGRRDSKASASGSGATDVQVGPWPNGGSLRRLDALSLGSNMPPLALTENGEPNDFNQTGGAESISVSL